MPQAGGKCDQHEMKGREATDTGNVGTYVVEHRHGCQGLDRGTQRGTTAADGTNLKIAAAL